ncbi:MAG: hypothetical protein RI932_2297, partial [Pseudomonadota bacterium]
MVFRSLAAPVFNVLQALLFFALCLAYAERIEASGISPISSGTVQLQSNTPELAVLAQEMQWKKILLYAPTWMFGKKSLVDDPGFFLADDGKSNPESELKATLKAFEQGSVAERQEALCRFPARRAWLESQLGRAFADPQKDNASEVCRRLTYFRKTVDANKVSLIFSSYYPGNPASLFGHTLLKLAKVQRVGESRNELLDFGLNHAAHPTTFNPLLYAPMGLAGAFPGYISLLPYYVKVQEYNNAESRDLWEYELSLEPQEIQLLLNSVFELSSYRIDYFYFDDNCSLMMLALLDVARPSLQLVEKFNAWVVPGDTIRVVYNQKGLVSKVNFRASNVRRFLTLEAKLSAEERALFNTILESKRLNRFSLAALDGLSAEKKMPIVDTLLEYIDADEQLVGTMEPQRWKAERPILLSYRAQLGIVSAPLNVSKPVNEAPHEAYPPTRISAGGISVFQSGASRRDGMLLGWRPALHSLDNPVAGMGADLGISFFNLEYLAQRHGIWLREFTLLGIETLPVDRPQFSSISWGLNVGYRQTCFADCGRTSVGGEIGRSWKLLGEGGRFALRSTIRVGESAHAGFFLEPGVASVLNIPFSIDKRWISRAAVTRTQSLRRTPVWNREIR